MEKSIMNNITEIVGRLRKRMLTQRPYPRRAKGP
jgi:hypothetical protein